MEFKYRAIDEQASMNIPPTISYFTEQALRAGYGNIDYGRSAEFFRNPSDADYGRNTEFFRNPSDVREVIQRELEKERIREEIIAAEIARKRLLEAEVRREMLIEREMALQRGDGFAFLSAGSSSSTMIVDPRLSILNHSEGRSLEERLALSLQERLGNSVRREIGGFESLPFKRKAEPKISEVKPLSEVSKDRVIFLGKPEGNLSGAKRKAVSPPEVGASDLASVGTKKKLKEEWSCALCQVTATSERGLNEHLQGKKHKNKEAGLRAQRGGKNFSIGLFPKKTAKLVEITEIPSSEHGEKLEGVQIKNNNEQSLQDNKDSDDLGNKNNRTEEQVLKMRVNKKNRFKFWCEMCHVGANFEKVMNKHKKGKKHMGRLLWLNNGGGDAPAPQMAEDTEMAKDGEVAGKERNKYIGLLEWLNNDGGSSSAPQVVEATEIAKDGEAAGEDKYEGASVDVDGGPDGAVNEEQEVVSEEQEAAIEVAANDTN